MHRQRLEVVAKKIPKNYITLSDEILKVEKGTFQIKRTAKVYKLEGSLVEKEVLEDVFCDPVVEDISFSHNDQIEDFIVEISFKPGVTDNPARSARMGVELAGGKSDIYSGMLYFIATDEDEHFVTKCAEKYLGNSLIENIKVHTRIDFNQSRFDDVVLPKMSLTLNKEVDTIDLNLDDKKLVELNNIKCWALSLSEIHCIRKHYQDNLKKREAMGMPSSPTDVEIEIIAQTWSEHCKHKIFQANIDFSENGNTEKISSLYKSYIKDTTKEIEAKNNIKWLKSVFSDNAGIVSYDENVDLCIKVETHNSPSALDPYGGALTGILGVNRDILGCGLGARPIANTNVFCFANPKLPSFGDEKKLPFGLLNPKQILTGVHKGVEDGGNKSGIPTVNGAMYFDNDYAGKPLVFVGTVGVMPKKLSDGRVIEKKSPRVGDRIIMLGGEIGADGIHGATFSSLELNEDSPMSAVQIGDPLTQKRVLDFLMAAQERGIYTSITDNGAGGLSSSVGEMAEGTNGATLYLDRCPLKYQGLSCYEIMISESQERMTLSVGVDSVKEFLALAESFGVIATDIGEFNDSGYLNVFWKNELAGSLDLNFLHNGLPKLNLKAHWDGPDKRLDWFGNRNKKKEIPLEMEKTLSVLFSSPNIASKERYVRQYDHEVQAATHIKPFCGKSGSGVNNSGGVWLYPHGGEQENGFLVGCGMNPRLSIYDPEYMAKISVDEAVRNIVANGADPNYISLLDNFCWPDPIESDSNPLGPYRLGQLVKTAKGLKKACLSYSTPLISGKDSMKNNFRGKNRLGEPLEISVLPTLLVTSLGKYNVKYSISSGFKRESDLIYLIGNDSVGLKASEFSEHFKVEDSNLPSIDLEFNSRLYKVVHRSIKQRIIQSCHDISDGGLITSVCESAFANNLGVELDLAQANLKMNSFLFSETPGRFVVSVNPKDEESFLDLFRGFNAHQIGHVQKENKLFIKYEQRSEKVDLNRLYKIWTGVFDE